MGFASISASQGDRLPYRTPEPLPTEVLEIRPEPAGARYMRLAGALLMAGPGVVEMGIAATHGAPLEVVIGAVQVVFGLAVLFGVRRTPTRIRFTYDDSDVSVTWLRGRRTMRTDRLKRTDLVDVGIDDTPTSGGSCYRLVLGTRLGDLVFTDDYSSELNHYEETARKIHRALAIPVRH